MLRGCLPIILVMLGVYAIGALQTVQQLSPSATPPTEQVISISGRYTAAIERCCADYNYIAAFSITDNQTGQTYHQRLNDIKGLNSVAGGIEFNWSPNEHYLVIGTDNRVTSHGCDEVLVYTGDGSQLVYTTLNISICHFLDADGRVSVLAYCDNDDLILSNGFRVSLPDGTENHTDETSCG